MLDLHPKMFSTTLLTALFAYSTAASPSLLDVDVTLDANYVPIAMRNMPLNFLNSTEPALEKRATKYNYAVAYSKKLTETRLSNDYGISSWIRWGPEKGQILKAVDELKSQCGANSCVDQYTVKGETRTETRTGSRGQTIKTVHQIGPDYVLQVNGKYLGADIKNKLLDSLKAAVGKLDQTNCRTDVRTTQMRNVVTKYYTRVCDFKVPKYFSIVLFQGTNLHSFLDFTITNVPVNNNSDICAIGAGAIATIVGLINPILGAIGSIAGSVACQ